MRRCPLCAKTKADDSFWSRRFKRMAPLCGRCFEVWRVKSFERSISGLSKSSDAGRATLDEAIQPWQIETSDKCMRRSVKHTPNERLDEMFKRRTPVNPTYNRL